MFEVPEKKQKRFAVDGMEIIAFDLPGLDDKLNLRVDQMGQVQIDRLSLRVVLQESEKAFAALRMEMAVAVEEAKRAGFIDGHASATGAPSIVSEGSL